MRRGNIWNYVGNDIGNVRIPVFSSSISIGYETNRTNYFGSDSDLQIEYSSVSIDEQNVGTGKVTKEVAPVELNRKRKFNLEEE
jgi:hypothetical protein